MSEIHYNSTAIAIFMKIYFGTFVSTTSMHIHSNLLAHTRTLRIVIRKYKGQFKAGQKCSNNVLHVIMKYSGPFHVGYKCSSSILHVISRYEGHSRSVTSVLCSSFLNF
jgi:hypothetical protein